MNVAPSGCMLAGNSLLAFTCNCVRAHRGCSMNMLPFNLRLLMVWARAPPLKQPPCVRAGGADHPGAGVHGERRPVPRHRRGQRPRQVQLVRHAAGLLMPACCAACATASRQLLCAVGCSKNGSILSAAWICPDKKAPCARRLLHAMRPRSESTARMTDACISSCYYTCMCEKDVCSDTAARMPIQVPPEERARAAPAEHGPGAAHRARRRARALLPALPQVRPLPLQCCSAGLACVRRAPGADQDRRLRLCQHAHCPPTLPGEPARPGLPKTKDAPCGSASSVPPCSVAKP